MSRARAAARRCAYACALALPLGLVGTACTKTVVEREPSPDATFPLGATPLVVPPAGVALVTNSGSDTLSVIDLAANAVARTERVATDPIATNGPHHVAIDLAGGFLYVPLAFPPPATGSVGPHGVHGTATRPGTLAKLRADDLSRVAIVTLDASPGDIVLTPDGAKVLVSHFDLRLALEAQRLGRPVEAMRASVMLIDAKTMYVNVAIPTCVAPHGMAMTDDGKTLYVACYGEDAVAVVHLDAPDLLSRPAEAVERFPVGPSPGLPGSPAYGPYALALAGDLLLVGETDARALDVLDRATRARLRSIPTRGAAYFAAPTSDPAAWIVPTQAPDQLLRVNVTTGAIERTRASVCVKPHQVGRHAGRYFVVCEGDHVSPGTLVEIDPTTLETLRATPLGVYPDAIAFMPGPR